MCNVQQKIDAHITHVGKDMSTIERRIVYFVKRAYYETDLIDHLP